MDHAAVIIKPHDAIAQHDALPIMEHVVRDRCNYYVFCFRWDDLRIMRYELGLVRDTELCPLHRDNPERILIKRRDNLFVIGFHRAPVSLYFSFQYFAAITTVESLLRSCYRRIFDQMERECLPIALLLKSSCHNFATQIFIPITSSMFRKFSGKGLNYGS